LEVEKHLSLPSSTLVKMLGSHTMIIYPVFLRERRLCGFMGKNFMARVPENIYSIPGS